MTTSSAAAAASIGWSDQVAKKNKGEKPMPARPVDDRVRTMRQPHRRALPAPVRGDERAESPLGRLALRHVIDEDQYDAGSLFAGIVRRYAASIDVPVAVHGTLGELTVSDYPADAETVENDLHPGCAAEQSGDAKFCRAYPEQCRCLARREAYTNAFEALAKVVGRRGVLVISRVIVHREEIAREDIVYLKRGLTALAQHFGLIGGRKRAD